MNQVEGQEKWMVRAQTLIGLANPGSSSVGCYKLAKAFWFEKLTPKIPIPIATLEEEEDDEDLEEEEEEDYLENSEVGEEEEEEKTYDDYMYEEF